VHPFRPPSEEECLVLAKTIAAAVLSSIAIAAGGCSGNSDTEAEGPVDITKLRAEFKERFGTPPYEAPWYRRITAINWANGHLEVTTDFTPEETKAMGLPSPCVEIWNLASEQREEPDETALIVAVFDAGGVRQGSCG
jgi:hypothetical protein